MTYIIREVCFELFHTLAPVRGCLLADELDIEEGPLSWAKHVTRGRPTDNSRGDIGNQILRENDTNKITQFASRSAYVEQFPLFSRAEKSKPLY